MLLGPVFSQQTVTLERAKELVVETGYTPIVRGDDGALFVSFLNPKNPDFFRESSLGSTNLFASPDGAEYRLTVAAIHFLANSMRNAESQ